MSMMQYLDVILPITPAARTHIVIARGREPPAHLRPLPLPHLINPSILFVSKIDVIL